MTPLALLRRDPRNALLSGLRSSLSQAGLSHYCEGF